MDYFCMPRHRGTKYEWDSTPCDLKHAKKSFYIMCVSIAKLLAKRMDAKFIVSGIIIKCPAHVSGLGTILYVPPNKVFLRPRVIIHTFLALQRTGPLPPSSVLDVRFPKDIYTYFTGCLISSFDLKYGFNNFPNLYTIHKEWKFGLYKSINVVYKTQAPRQIPSGMLLKTVDY